MSMLRTSAALALTIAVVVLAAPTMIGSVASAAEQDVAQVGGIGLRLAEAPVNAADDPRARVYIVDHLAPGTVIERRIEVSNTTASAQHVALYAAGASIDDGSFAGAAGEAPNELSSWTSVAPSEVELESNGTLTATVVVAVPADAAPGEQYGVIWAEARSDPGEGGGVVQVSRVGIRMYVSVGPGGAPAADFSIDSLAASRSADGLPLVTASVQNTGGRALDMSGTLMLSNGPGGLNAGPFAVDVGRTLAVADGQDVLVTLDSQVPAGPWDASISLESGLTVRTVEATITFPDEGSAAAVDTRTGGSVPLWPMLVAAGGIVALAAAGAVLVARRRRGRRTTAAARWLPPSGAPAAAPTDR